MYIDHFWNVTIKFIQSSRETQTSSPITQYIVTLLPIAWHVNHAIERRQEDPLIVLQRIWYVQLLSVLNGTFDSMTKTTVLCKHFSIRLYFFCHRSRLESCRQNHRTGRWDREFSTNRKSIGNKYCDLLAVFTQERIQQFAGLYNWFKSKKNERLVIGSSAN